MIGSIGALDFSKIGGSSGLSQGGGASAGSAASSPTTSFASMLSDVATNAVGSLQKAEQMSVAGIQGKADTRDVVDAVMSAEQALQAAVAIRDKIVSAYMEISRMSI
jgi:flagellar hook-basal body complex protein FliE